MLPKKTWVFTPFQISKSVIAWTIAANTYTFQTNKSQLLHLHWFTGSCFIVFRCSFLFPDLPRYTCSTRSDFKCQTLLMALDLAHRSVTSRYRNGGWIRIVMIRGAKVLYSCTSFVVSCCFWLLRWFFFFECQWLPGKRHILSVIQVFLFKFTCNCWLQEHSSSIADFLRSFFRFLFLLNGQDCHALWAHCDEGEGVGPNFCLVLPQNMCRCHKTEVFFQQRLSQERWWYHQICSEKPRRLINPNKVIFSKRNKPSK